jgi:hypothetical protein
MSNTIHTQTHVPQPQPGFFRRITKAIGDAINPPTPPAREPPGADRYSQTPASVASVRRNQSLLAGYGKDGRSARQTSAPVSDTRLFDFLDELSGTGGPNRRT